MSPATITKISEALAPLLREIQAELDEIAAATSKHEIGVHSGQVHVAGVSINANGVARDNGHTLQIALSFPKVSS